MTNLIETLTWEFDKNNLFLWCFVECDTVSVGDTSNKFDIEDRKNKPYLYLYINLIRICVETIGNT